MQYETYHLSHTLIRIYRVFRTEKYVKKNATYTPENTLTIYGYLVLVNIGSPINIPGVHIYI